MDIVIGQFSEIVVSVFVVLAVAGLGKCFGWISRKVKNDTVNGYLQIVRGVVSEAVIVAGNTTVATMKKSGTFDKAAALKVRDDVKKEVEKMLPGHVVDLLVKGKIDVNTLLNTMIERELITAKESKSIKEI